MGEPASEEPAPVEEAVEEPKKATPRKRGRKSDVDKTPESPAPTKKSRRDSAGTPKKDDAPEDKAEKAEDDWVMLDHPTEEEIKEMKEQEAKVEETKTDEDASK